MNDHSKKKPGGVKPGKGPGNRPAPKRENMNRGPQDARTTHPTGRPVGNRPPGPTSARPPVPSGRRPKKRQRSKGSKIALFMLEILVLLVLLVVFWGASKASELQYVEIKDEEIEINEEVKEATESGALKGYRNIVLFGVDSTEHELTKNTRTDTMMIFSINMDTKEVKMVSLYRDTYVNLSTDTYGKANSAYAKGGPKQAINMMNMNMDLNITDFVTVGFDAVVDVIDAVGGVEIDVQEAEIEHLNNYQMCIVGEPDGTYNAAGEPNYYAEPYVEFTPVEKPGLQTLNGVQATAYMRIRYVGNDFARTTRQQTVLKEAFKKALTLNPVTLNEIADAVFPKVSTSLELGEITELLGGAAGYKFTETSKFPFTGEFDTGYIKRASVIIPNTLEENVTLLHEFFFGEEGYEPSDTVKRVSQKIQSDAAGN